MFLSLALASYFLCGSDEDGCLEGYEQYCACIPMSAMQNQPYCLDLDNMTCKPVTQQPDCAEKEIIVANQGKCLATMLQSVTSPSCREVSQAFCIEHAVTIYDEDGHSAL